MNHFSLLLFYTIFPENAMLFSENSMINCNRCALCRYFGFFAGAAAFSAAAVLYFPDHNGCEYQEDDQSDDKS